MPTRTTPRRSSRPAAADVRAAEISLDSPRVRFNWGFHNATADEAAGRPARDMSSHFCRPYAAGYLAGRTTMAGLMTAAAAAGTSAERPESSEPAWLEHQTSPVATGAT